MVERMAAVVLAVERRVKDEIAAARPPHDRRRARPGGRRAHRRAHGRARRARPRRWSASTPSPSTSRRAPSTARTRSASCRSFVAERLGALGADVDLFEPDAGALRDHPMMPPWHHWRRPADHRRRRSRAAGGGRSLIVNGHIDVVSPGDLERWTTPPFDADVRDGRIYGRGAVDMKGGVAAAMFALEALVASGVRLAGDVIFQVVPDEETCAMGTVAVIERGYRADAGLVPEPTRLNFWIATRGLLHGSVSVPGRSAHAEMNQPPWQQGGGVNAIEKSVPVLQAFRGLSAEWATRESKAHPLLGRPCVQPTIVRGGAFISNVPGELHDRPQRDLPARGCGRPGLRQRAARRDPERRRGRRSAATTGSPRARPYGPGRPTTRRRRSTPARRSSPSRARRRPSWASMRAPRGSTRPTTARC